MQSTLLNGSPNSHKSEHEGTDLTSLAQALVLLARQLERPCEEAQAYRLLSEAMRSHPGTVQKSWWIWLLSAGRSLGLTLRVSDVPTRDFSAILQSGALLVTERSEAQQHRLNFRELDSKGIILVGSLPTTVTEVPEQRGSGNLIRVIIASGETDFPSAHHHDEKPWVTLWKLLAPDQKDLWAVATISGVAGLLMLSVPITAQQLVRTVTFAALYQPIVVLSLMLLGLLGFVAALQALQVYVSEIIQRRLFLRIAGQVTQRLTRADSAVWRQIAMPELVNRFLEVAIVQKVTASLMVDGIAILLTTLISLSVMAFYHPFLLGYDIVLLVLLATIFFGFGRNGVKTAIQESRAKYGVLSWLEDMARCPGIFRTGGVDLLAMQRTDVLCAHYLHARRSHFAILLRQIVLILILQAIATTALLGLGGFLVLNEQLTLGQLVAAELIVATIVASFAKLGKHLEGWYDLMASIDKLSHLVDLPSEPHDGLIGLTRQGAAAVSIQSLSSDESNSTSHASVGQLLDLAPGERAALLNWNPASTHDLAEILRGARGISSLTVQIDAVRTDDIRPDVLRVHAAVARELELLPATISENIHLSRPNVTEQNVRAVCDATGLSKEMKSAGMSLSTQLLPVGWPLDELQTRRLILARALAGQPRLLLIDHLLDVFAESDVVELWQQLSQSQPQTTILVATVREDIAQLVGRSVTGPRDHHRLEQKAHT